MPLEENRILRGPNISFPEQHLNFRLPEQQLPPPDWCTGPRAGDILGGGTANPSVIRQWWRDFAGPGDSFLCNSSRKIASAATRCGASHASNVQAERLTASTARRRAKWPQL